MTVNNFIEKIVMKNPNQLVTIYNEKHNIIYHGKADFAPLTLYMEFKNSKMEDCVDITGKSCTTIVINGEVDEQKDDINNIVDTDGLFYYSMYYDGIPEKQLITDIAESYDVSMETATAAFKEILRQWEVSK